MHLLPRQQIQPNSNLPQDNRLHVTKECPAITRVDDLFSTPATKTVEAWNLGVHRQAAAGHSSHATIGQGQSQGSQKKPRYDLCSSKKPRTENMNIR